MIFENAPQPTTSPWGEVQHSSELAPGIWQVMTASHGGIFLSRQRLDAMPAILAQ